MRFGCVHNLRDYGIPRDTVYYSILDDEWPAVKARQVDLVPSGKLYARDNPTLKGSSYVFHAFRDGALMSLRQSDVRKVTMLTGDDAFWAQQGLDGEGVVEIDGNAQCVEADPAGNARANPADEMKEGA